MCLLENKTPSPFSAIFLYWRPCFCNIVLSVQNVPLFYEFLFYMSVCCFILYLHAPFLCMFLLVKSISFRITLRLAVCRQLVRLDAKAP
jgi:hypothetical protein